MMLRALFNEGSYSPHAFGCHGSNLLWAAAAAAAMQGAGNICDNLQEVQRLRLQPVHHVSSRAHASCSYETQQPLLLNLHNTALSLGQTADQGAVKFSAAVFAEMCVGMQR
jgi:hypothetical protein